MSKKYEHEGHRERVREKLEEQGVETFDDVEILEFLLFNVLTRIDTKPVVKRLLKKFGSLSGVLNADEKDLLTVEGVGEKTTKYLTKFPSIIRYYMEDLNSSTKRIYDSNSAIEMLRPSFIGLKKEAVAVLMIDSSGKILFNDILWVGAVAQVPIYTRELVEKCIRYNADTVFVAHNHTSGNPAPSRNDLVATKELQFALESIFVNLDDHIIFTEKGFTSMKRSGWLKDVVAATSNYRNNILQTARDMEAELGLE